MENLLSYPQSTIVDKVVPKTMFYKFMEVNQRMKVRFVNDVAQICWLYKLSANTLNVTAREELIEIDVFVVTLKAQDCPTDVFTFIDTNMPHHIVFILKYEEQYMLLINYKKWKDNTHTQFKITKSFATTWMNSNQLSLAIQGQSLPRIYDNFVAQGHDGIRTAILRKAYAQGATIRCAGQDEQAGESQTPRDRSIKITIRKTKISEICKKSNLLN